MEMGNQVVDGHGRLWRSRPLRVQTSGSTQVRDFFIRPGDYELGPTPPVPKYPDGLPLFCQVVSTEGKLILLGGWDPSSWEPVRDVFLYEFTTQKWTQCADMPSTRSFFAVGAVEGKVLVAGGHDESKNALNSAWVLDVKKNEWCELGRMREERDECEGVVVGSEFWVVSGYGTETQGVFKRSAEVYGMGRGGGGEWRVEEEAWEVSGCPRSCVGVEKGKKGNSLICWGEVEAAVKVGVCVVEVGEKRVVTGSEYQGGPHGFYVKGKEGKMVRW
ncbi:UNVERIFIED_CONTAM: F-box/kelch-repeat protein [Sesamum latifolium]|uniref:F-box/kelch-repeat protein n=1 Tax=Sesamum latifolium TaxID=2727402 RepID=A0AAW2XL34_9LAMI